MGSPPGLSAGNRLAKIVARGSSLGLILALSLSFAMCQGARSGSDSPKSQATIHLETFVLNLADAEQHSYLRIGIDLEVDRSTKLTDNDSARSVALMRDTILGVLTTANPDEILTSDGKAKLKTQLLQALRSRAPELGVHEVYFTEFLVQR